MTTLRPRWPEGSLARVLHALALWVGFVAIRYATYLAPPLGGLTFAVSAALVYGVLYGHLMMRVGRLRAADLGLTLVGWRREVAVGLAAMLAMTVLLLGWIAVHDGAGEVSAALRQIAGMPAADRLVFLGVGLLAASAEDTLFRGYLQPALMARWGSAVGVVLTMALFQVHHFTEWPTLQRIGIFAITGLGFGIPRWRDRPLIASYVAHVGLWTLWGTT